MSNTSKWLDKETADKAVFPPPLFLQEKNGQRSNKVSPSKTFITKIDQSFTDDSITPLASGDSQPEPKLLWKSRISMPG